MTHKEKCNQLKEIRRQIADTIGVELHQTECTYKGECKGTCPRCQQEERKLNKALLGKTAAVACLAASAISLTGCGSVKDLTSERNISTESRTTTEYPELGGTHIYDPTETTEEIIDGLIELEGDTTVELEGDIAYIPEPTTTEETIEVTGDICGEIEYIPDNYTTENPSITTENEYINPDVNTDYPDNISE